MDDVEIFSEQFQTEGVRLLVTPICPALANHILVMPRAVVALEHC